MRAIVCCIAVLVLAWSSSAVMAGSGAYYNGTARALAVSASEAKFDRRIAVHRETPTRGKRTGFRSGVEAEYDDAGGSPRASITIYVYDSEAAARKAYRDSCRPPARCTPASLDGGVAKTARYRDTFLGLPARCGATISARENVYVAAVVCGISYPFRHAIFDTRFLVQLTHSRVDEYVVGAR